MRKGKKFRGVLTFIIVIAVVALIALLGLFAYDKYDEYNKQKIAEDIVATFEQNIEEKLTEERLQKENEKEIAEGGEKTRRRSKRTDYTTRYNDCIVVGTIRIPSINIKYPIMKEQSEEALEIGVAVLYGEGINKVGNTVIIGHNYVNGALFGRLGKLSKGKSIFIKDESGEEIEYTVYKVFPAKENDASFYNRETNGKREITLSTCNKDGSARTIVLAKEK